MKSNASSPENVDSYIASFSEEIQERLCKIRKAIQDVAGEATETMKYRMPTYVLNENIVHFAGYEHHVGFYPTPSGIVQFAKELEKYPTSKGAVQFPHDKPIPITLVKKIVKFRLKEAAEKAARKKVKKSK